MTVLRQWRFLWTGARMRFAVASGTGRAEVVDHLESARAALDRALALASRGRKNVRVFDEDGMQRSLADVRRLAD